MSESVCLCSQHIDGKVPVQLWEAMRREEEILLG